MGNDVLAYSQVQALSQDRVVDEYGPMVKRIAYHLLGRLPKNVQLDDLIQAGMMGLLDAAKHYNPSKGASFSTYAGIRIRGTMLDEVRRNDWVPRSVHRNSRRVTEAIRLAENKLGRDPTDAEIIATLDIKPEEYHHILADASHSQVFGFDDVGLTDDFMMQGYAAEILGPDKEVMDASFRDTLAQCIDNLPEREKLVLSLYYEEDLNLKEIGAVLDVSESRVCQIHSQATCRLKAKMAEAWQ